MSATIAYIAHVLFTQPIEFGAVFLYGNAVLFLSAAIFVFLFRFETAYFHWGLILLLINIYLLGQIATTSMAIFAPVIYYSVALLPLSLIWLEQAQITLPNTVTYYRAWTMGCYLMLLALGLLIQFNFAYRDVKPLASQATINIGLLQGVRTESSKQHLLENLVGIYNHYDCKDKTFLTFVDQPLLYYFFQRPAMGEMSWLSPEIPYVAPREASLQASLQNPAGWCVFTTVGNATEAGFVQFLPSIGAYIKQHSQKVVVVRTVAPGSAQSYPMEYRIYIR